MTRVHLYLASHCYGGVAQARFLRSVLALRTAFAGRGIALQLDLGGGEALLSRARAGMMARFLAGQASHLAFVDGDREFGPEQLLALLAADEPIAEADGIYLIRRDVALDVSKGYPELQAGLSDVRHPGTSRAVMAFEAIIEPRTQNYLVDTEAFAERYRRLHASA